MAKQLGIDLSIKADASQATQEIKSLQQNLYKIMNMSSGSGGLSEEMKQSAAAAKELQYHLNQAYNSSTGNIDLSKLNTSLQKSNASITELSNRLLSSGQIGRQAFTELAGAISKADYPMFKLNSKLTEMWTTLKNTARWQLSSSMLHGFMGAIQQATSYAQKLDTSLNNIRIVTGMSSSEMDRFAESANRAAKALSTTTTEYTDASLIFFQQGLGAKEVEERTAITIKMAQAAGESATDISSYMTAIWNNFEGGKETLQSFADSMVRLGADTAASSSEIATSLEKFASIGETVGLSFDYATAAATTIIDKTRAGAETVGTALKTIFARLEGLQLGETLEDGVDLNKYTEALKVVGVEVLDLNGNLRDADDIIFDLGNTWDTLTRAQQMALAQTVAGTRQYTQLMSLMNNFDSFLENVDRSKNADGSLEEQAEIAADSWEKAKNRVQAAAEGIYESLIDRDFMKNYNNILADVLTGVDKLIEGFGGLGGVVSVAGSFILSLISHKIQPAIQGLIVNIQNLFTSAQTRAQQLVSTMQTKISSEIKSGKYDTSQTQQLKNSSLLAEARAKLTVVSRRLTDEEKQLYQIDINNIEMNQQKAQAIADTINNLEKELDTLILVADATDSNTEATRIYNQMLKEQREMSQDAFSRAMSGEEGSDASFEEYFAAEQAIAELQDRKMVLNETINDSVEVLLSDYESMKRMGEGATDFKVRTEEAIQPWKNLMGELKNTPKDASSLNSYKSALEMISKSMPSVMKQSKEMQTALKNAFDASTPEAFDAALEQIEKSFDSVVIDGKNIGKVLRELNPKSFQELEAILKKIIKEERELKTVNEELVNSINNFKPEHLITGVERLTSAAAAMGQVAMIGSSISSMINALNSQDMSFGERLSTILMSVSMIIPGIISSLSSLGHALEGTAAKEAIVSTVMKITNKDRDIAAAKTILLTKAKEAELTADQTATIVKGSLAAAVKAEGLSVSDNTLNVMKLVVAKKIQNGATEEEIAAWIASKLGCDADTASKIANKIATDSLKTSISSLLGPIALVVAAMGLLIGVVKAYNKAKEEEEQRGIENRSAEIDAIMKESEAYRTAREEYQELLKTYNEAIASSDGTAQAQKAIADATWDLCEALGIEIDYLDRLQGKTEGYNQKILEKQADEANKKLQGHKVDRSTIDAGIADDYNDYGVDFTKEPVNKDYAIEFNHKNGEIQTNNFGDGTLYLPAYGNVTADKADQTIMKYIKDFLETDFKNKEIVKSGASGGGLKFVAGATNSEIYEVLDQLVAYLKDRTSGDNNTRSGSEIYNWYDDIVDAGRDTYNKLTEIDADAENYIQDYAVNQTQLDMKMMFQEIETAEDYNKMRQQLIENIYAGYEKLGYTKETGLPLGDFESETELITSLVNKYIENYDNLMDLESLEDVAEKTNIPIDKIEKLFGEYSDVFFDASIQFDENLSLDNLTNILKILDAEAKTKKIQTKVEVTSEAKSKLKKNMSVNDYEDFESESGIAWGETDEILNKDIISYGEFLALTYEQQVAYLEGLEQEYLTKQSSTISTSITEAQNLLKTYQEELNGLKEKETAGTISEADTERMAELTTMIETLQEYLPELYGTMTAVNGQVLNSVSSFDELVQKIQEIQDSGGEVTLAEYGNALVTLGENFDNCAKEIEDWNLALMSGDISAQEMAADALAGAVIIGEAAEKYDLDAEAVEAQADRMAKAYNLSAEEAAKLAVKNQRMNKGVKSLTDNWEEWKKELNKTDKLTTDYADAVVDVTAAIADLVGACDDLELPDEFFNDENMKLIEKAANGDVAAINKLGAAVAETTVEAMTFQQSLADLAITTWELNDLDVTPELRDDWVTQFETDKDTVLAGIQQIKSGAISSGDAMDAEWVAALNRMALATGMSVEEMNGLLGSLGVQAKVETTYVKQPMEVPTYEEHWETTKFDPGEKDEKGEWIRPPSFSRKKYTVPGAPYTVEGYVPVAQISTEDNPLTLDVDTDMASPTTPPSSSAASYSGNRGSVSPSSTEKDDSGSDSGSDSEPEEIDKTDKDDIVERYKEINDALDDMSRAYDRVSKAADRAYGKNRISLLKQANGLLQQEIDLLKIKQAEAQTNFDQDQANLAAAASAAGLSFDFDPETGNILNYTDQMNGLYARLASAEAGADPSNFSTKEEQDDYIKNYIEPLEKLIEELETAYGKYEETKELRQDLQEEFDSKFYEWQDNNAEILTYTLELKLEIEDRELEKIEYMLSKIEDDFFSLAEAAALMTGYSEETGEMAGGQYASYVQNLESYEEQISSLKEALDNEQISEEAYAAGLQTIYEGIYENLGNIDALDKAMMNYYGDTISAAQEELSKYTDQLEHHNSVLSHYKSLMEIMGKSTDYQKMGTILKGQAEVAKNSMDVAQKNAEMYAGEAAKKLEAYETAMKNKNYEAAELYKKEYEAALAAAQEAEEEYLQSAEEYAQSLRDILENELAGFAQDLENALTGGTSFDQLNDKLSRAKSLQEEYLTTTNKIYETNKLMNTAQMEIDKTTNSVAKNRLKQFIAETNQLQEKNKLSQFELEIQQAKYDLLLAEIALEEAQNAKSTVRLSRDSEGNFGYVYTADDSKIAEAEQKLADEQNRLYNISLEGVNNYTEKYQQTLNEMYDTLTELQQQYLEGAFESEQEYNDAVTAAKEYYYEKLEQYSSLHAVALTTDSRVIEEAWSSEFSSMVYSTDKWKRNVETYVGQVKTAFKSWETQMKNLEKRLRLDKIKDAVKKVTDESAKLTEELTKTDGVIDSLQAEFDAVSLVTGAWAEQRDVVLELIGYYEDLADTVQTTLDTMALGDDDEDENDPPTNNPPTNNPPSNRGGGDGKLAVGDMVTYDSGYYYYDSAGTKPLGNRGVGEGKKAKITRIVSGAAYPIHLYSTDNAYGWVKKDQISGFDSGGYTGDWGSDGKLAVLHEKELVLNKDDTENLLRTIELLRQTYDKDNTSVDSSAIFDLLRTSHNDLTALYEEELLSLNKEMHEIASESILKSNDGYTALIASCEDSLNNLNKDMGLSLSIMEKTYSEMQRSCDAEFGKMRNNMSAELNNNTKTYDKMVSEYSGQMLSLNKEMYSQFEKYQKEHEQIISSYESSLNEVASQALKTISLIGQGSYGKGFGGIRLEEKQSSLKDEKFSQDMEIMNEAIRNIDLQKISAQIGGLLSSPSLLHAGKEEVLKQQVEISASFPNVTDHNELEEAFNNLINQASQYASKKKKNS